jgi:P4 family phage/plasmid primase-like protien
MTQTELFKIAKKMKQTNDAFVPIPASKKEKRPIGKWAGNSYVFEKDFQKRQILESDCNLGLLVSDLYVVVDVDNKPPAVRGSKKVYSENKGTEDFQRLVEANELLPETLSATTPSGGKHYYFLLTGDEAESRLKNWTACMSLDDGSVIGVDLRKKGGYVMCPPSRKGTKYYVWDTPEEYKAKMKPLPKWILKNILETQKKHPKHFEDQKYTCEPESNGEVDDEDVRLLKQSPFWRDSFRISNHPDKFHRYIITATEPYQCDICQRRHVKNTNHPFLVRHHGKLRFVCRPGKGFNRVIEPDHMQQWRDFKPRLCVEIVEGGDNTDQAISNLLAAHLRNTVMATVKPHQWLVFEKETGIWREEHKNVVLRPTLEYLSGRFDALHALANRLKGDKEDGVWKDRATCSALISIRMKETKYKNYLLPALFEKVRDTRRDKLMNSKGHLLHCENCVIDLQSGEVRSATPEDYSTKSTHLKYVPYEEHPETKRLLVEKFFDDIMLGDREMIEFLLRVLSSPLDAKIRFQFFFFMVGKGSNGKSLLIKLMKKALGDYYASIPTAQVTRPNVNAQSSTPALMQLSGARAAFLTELEDRTLYTEFLKMLAGGDSFSGRNHYEGQQEIVSTARAFIAVNDPPKILDRTDGFWRKLVYIPFEAHFRENLDPRMPNQRQLDETMEDKMLDAADTFLALLVQYHLNEYRTKGIGRAEQPEKVLEAGRRYQYEQDLPLQFYETTCIVDSEKYAETKEVHEAFSEFCKHRAVTKTSELVKHLDALMDEKHPPKNPRRQMKNQLTKNKNVRAWAGVTIEHGKWSIVDEEDGTEDEVVDPPFPGFHVVKRSKTEAFTGAGHVLQSEE